MSSFMVGVLFFAVYFLPSILGFGKRNFNSIVMLNLFLGWTLIGWVVAIIWAVSYEKPIELNVNKSKYDKVTDQLIQLKKLYEDGTLTEEEFNTGKKRLLK